MDEALLLGINQTLANPLFDALFGWVSQKRAFTFPVLSIILVLFWQKWSWNGVKFWFVMILAILLGDLLGNLLKHLIGALRPCVELAGQVRLVESPFSVSCSQKPRGMPSNHALNYFLVFAFLAWVLQSKSWIISFGVIAMLVGVSRVYLGVHYPSQVLAGSVIGVLLGLLFAGLAIKIFPFVKVIHQEMLGHKASSTASSNAP